MQTPCEQYKWTILPSIRRELAICLIEKFNLTQAETARKLDLSRSAISQYLNGKRGNYGFNKQMLNEISFSAAHISEKGKSVVETEVCRLCKLIRDNEEK